MPGPVDTYLSPILAAIHGAEEPARSIRRFVDDERQVKRSSEGWLRTAAVTLLAALLTKPTAQQPDAVKELDDLCRAYRGEDDLMDMTTKKIGSLLRRPYFSVVAPTSYATAIRDGLIPRPDYFSLTSTPGLVSGPNVYGARTKAPHREVAELLDRRALRHVNTDKNAAGASHLIVMWAVTLGAAPIPVASFYMLEASNLDPRVRHRDALKRDSDATRRAFAAAAGYHGDLEFRYTFQSQFEALLDGLEFAAVAAGHDPFAGRPWVVGSLAYPTAEQRDATTATPRLLYLGDDFDVLALTSRRAVEFVGQSLVFGTSDDHQTAVREIVPAWMDDERAASADEVFGSVDWQPIDGHPLMRYAYVDSGPTPATSQATFVLVGVGFGSPGAWRGRCRVKDVDAIASACAHRQKESSRMGVVDEKTGLKEAAKAIPQAQSKQSGPDRETLATFAVLCEQLRAAGVG